MELLAFLNLDELALAMSQMSMYPLFESAHYIVSVMSLKEQPGAVEVACRSPVACWVSSMLYCFGGAILSAVLLAEPPVEPFSNNSHVLVASLIWYLMFYCPQDLVYSCTSLLPVRLVLSGMKEVTRTWKVLGGVVQAQKKYQNSLLVMIVVGWAKGSGHGLISNFEQLVRGVWRPETNELLKMSYATKVTLIGAIVFSMQQSHILPVQKHQLMFLYTLFLVINKVRMMLTAPSFPFAPVETAIYRVLFGMESTHSPSANEADVSVTSPPETCTAAAEAIKPASPRHNGSVCCDAEQNAAPSAEADVDCSLKLAARDDQQTAAERIRTD
uniref:Trimeric intracellular cation channel type B-like n=1 Tax=Paramormyrops kingsleyae TaxID=1676925 RepID=A0A3B3SWE2_9TELE|nr:trimeric intracellular cation channel type B-like isoform X1 [Paramormyrops kingsleyae]